jgi:phage replication-related protein YjqB (UPF0714/DUF867 family)
MFYCYLGDKFLLKIIGLTICIYSVFSASQASSKGYWGRFGGITDLERSTKRGKDYEIQSWYRPEKPLVFAIHGGNIESGTGELAQAIAAQGWSLYHFKGITAPDYDHKIKQSGFMHLTSHKFNAPLALEMAQKSKDCLSLHGFSALKHKVDFCVGGANKNLRLKLTQTLRKNFPKYKSCELCCPPYLGRHPKNIVNRCASLGVQVEMSPRVRGRILKSELFTQRLAIIMGKIFE